MQTRHFAKWATKVGLSDKALCEAIREILDGLVDADLGGGVIKKRISLPGRGKSGSTRTLLATNKNNRWIFVFGFEKNERDNITSKELEALQALSSDLLQLSNKEIKMAIDDGCLVEVKDEKNNS